MARLAASSPQWHARNNGRACHGRPTPTTGRTREGDIKLEL